jgi:hypothetical protein
MSENKEQAVINPPSEEEKKKIIAESAARRIAFVGMLDAFRELIPAYMHDVVFTDKYILNSGKKSLNKMFKQFDSQRVGDNPYHDSVVEKFVAMAEDIRQQTEELLMQAEND